MLTIRFAMPIPVEPDIQTIEQRMNALPDFNSRCFELFRQWTAKVKEEMPDWEPEVEDEQEIVKALKQAFFEAIHTSFEDPEYLELMEDLYFHFVVCFITGYVQGTLTVRWSLRYLPPNKEYRYMLWMKSILQYFSTFPDAAQEVNGLFMAYTESGFGLKKREEKLTQEDFAYYRAIGDLQFEQNHLEMLSLLYLNMLDHTLKFKDNTKEVDVIGVMDLFDAPNVTFLLTGKWYKATPGGPYDEDGYTFEWVQ